MVSSEADDSLLFDDAADYVAAQVTAGNGAFSDKAKLALYALYKQGTVGTCNVKKPGIFDPAGRTKWDAWNKLGSSMSCEEAKAKYVQALTEISPDWQEAHGQPGSSAQGAKKSGMGPVFSAFAVEDADDAGGAGEASIHELAGQGDCKGVAALLASGTGVNSVDDAGCTALHFACDRGCLDVMQLLIGAGADVNCCDEDGQSPLHYAALCGQQEACKLLLSNGADAHAKDSEGKLAMDLSPPVWSIWQV